MELSDTIDLMVLLDAIALGPSSDSCCLPRIPNSTLPHIQFKEVADRVSVNVVHVAKGAACQLLLRLADTAGGCKPQGPKL